MNHGSIRFFRDYATSIIFIVLLGTLFILLAQDSSYLTDSFELLIPNNMDDLTQFRIVGDLNRTINEGRWIDVWAYTSYSYGISFWLPMGYITNLCLQYGSDSLAILIPRLISLVAYFACFAAMYAICQARGYKRINTWLVVLAPATCAAPLLVAKQYHTYTLVPAIALWAFYFLMLPSTRKNFFTGCILFGFAVGMKMTVLCIAPAYFIFFNEQLLRNMKLIKWRSLLVENFKATTLIAIAALFSFTPTFLLWPFGNQRFLRSLNELYSLGAGNVSSTINLAERLRLFLLYQYHYPIILGALIGIFYTLLKNRRQGLHGMSVALASLSSGAVFVAIALVITDLKGIYSYAIPALFIFPLIFGEVAKKSIVTAVLFILVGSNYLLNFTRHTSGIRSNQIFASFAAYREHVERVSLLKDKLPTDTNLLFIMHEATVFPSQPVRNYENTVYINLPPTDEQWSRADFLVLRKDTSEWKNPCDPTKTAIYISPVACELIKSAIAGSAPFEVFHDDNYMRAVRRITRP